MSTDRLVSTDRSIARSSDVSPRSAAAPAAELRVSLALFAALAVAAGSLHVLFEGQAWLLVVVAALAVVLAVAGVVRRLTVNAFAPSAAATVSLLVVLTVLFAPGRSFLAVVPTLDTLGRFAELVREAGASIYRQAVPADADIAIVFVLTAGLGLVAIASDAIVVTAQRPVFAAVPLIGIMAIVPITETDALDPLVFALAAACYLLLLVAGRGSSQPGLAAAIGATAIVGALVIPAALPVIGQAPAVVPGIAGGINPVLDLGDDLRRSAERDVISYSTSSGEAHYLRLVSLDLFTGGSWRPGKGDIDTANTVDTFAAPPGVTPAIASTSEITTIDVGDLASRWLPTPYPATSISGLSDDWYWEPEGFSVSSGGRTAKGESYEVDSLQLLPTPQQLLDAQSTVGPEFDRYRDLPEDLPQIIADTAQTITDPSPTNYQKALALQEFFRSSEFRYSEQAPVDGDYDGTGMDVIARFLEERAGYCIHYASAMAVMARSIGIPARVVVGFLPGDPISSTADDDDDDDDDSAREFQVTSHDLHTWPELYFDDIGWVQFEPTPGRGSLNQYADITAEGVPGLDEIAPAPAATTAPQAPAPAPSRPADELPGGLSGAAVEKPSALPEIALGIGVLVLLVLLPAGLRWAERRRLLRRLREHRAGAVDAWAEVLRTAVDLGVPVSTTETPRMTARGLAALSGAVGGEPLARLLDAVEREQYGTAAAAPASAPLSSDVKAVRRALLDAVPESLRILALLRPASTWRRIGRLRRRAGPTDGRQRATTQAGVLTRPDDPVMTSSRPRRTLDG